MRPTVATGGGHRLDRLIGWLDCAIELGANGLLLGPIFASKSHGYDTIDHFRLDPRLGEEADFDRLIAAAGKRGLSVVLDGVFNHVSREHPAFQEVVARGEDAAHARWFRRSPAREPAYDVFEGHSELVTLNHETPEVEEFVAAVMNHWLDRRAGGLAARRGLRDRAGFLGAACARGCARAIARLMSSPR